MVKKFKSYLTKFFSNSPKAKFVVSGIIAAGLILTISSNYKTITVNVDGEQKQIKTFKGTVKGVLAQNDIEVAPKDKVEPSLDSKVSKDSMINIERAVDIEVEVDGETKEIQTTEDTINDMLVAEGISLNNLDKVEPEVSNEISDGLKVKITRVEEKMITENHPIEFETVVKNDDTLDSSVTKTLQEGVTGEKTVVTKVFYEDGEEIGRETVSETVSKEPVQKVVSKGTANTLALSRGQSLQYKKILKMEATAYSGDGITATGTVPRRIQGGISTIAVDPRVIPLGSKVYVEGYGYAIAEDTGGAIKSNIIDIFLNSDSECRQWGRRQVNVYILS